MFTFIAATMIMPIDIQDFLQCDFYKSVERKIEENRLQLVPSDFFDVRDLTLLRLLQTNAQRPMPVRNINRLAIERAKQTNEGGAVISVSISLIIRKTLLIVDE